MESTGVPSTMHPNMGPGILRLEMSLEHHPPQQTPQNPQPQISVFEQKHHPGQTQQLPPNQTSSYPYAGKPKIQTLTLSEDDEQGQTTENSADDGNRTATTSSSPWHRMKWTDNMVRLLITVVFYIGDEVSSEGNDLAARKKGSGGVLQKKGKWKSVSTAMMERGFCVSPQQCEDKFNDLNKRYKRVNDILGKGTACKVVENQNLLDKMDHLTPKMKDEVKKLLNSKHLFFREMCAYHNTCCHGDGPTQQSPEITTEPSISSQQKSQHHQICQHFNENPSMERSKTTATMAGLEKAEQDDGDKDEDDDGEDDEIVNYDDDTDDKSSSKRQRTDRGCETPLPLVQKLSSELENLLEDEARNVIEKRLWMKAKLMELEEQHVGYECESFELEKQRLKWVKYCFKKERDMERDKLRNERSRLENERMGLLIRHKEMELIDHCHQQQHSSSKSN